MTSSSGKLRQSVTLIVIVIIAVSLLLIYLFIYVKDKESYVNRRNYKELANIAQNLQRKIRAYEIHHVPKNFLQYNLDFILANRKINFRAHDIDKIETTDTLKTELRNEIEKERSDWSLDFFKRVAPNDLAVIKKKKLRIDSSRLIFENILLYLCRKEGKLSPSENWADSVVTYTSTTSITVADFINPLLREDIFTEYLLVNVSNIRDPILYESHPLVSRDSIKALLTSVNNGVHLNGVDYKCFAFNFSVEQGNWILIGLQDEESYLNETRNFERSTLHTIVLISLLIVLAIPWTKVVLISKHEKLSKNDVTLCGISLLLACFLWTIIIVRLDYDHLYKTNDQNKSHVEDLASKIEKNFLSEIGFAYHELKTADSCFIQKDFTEIIKQGIYRNCYESFDFISWIDSSGNQRYKWATEKKPTRKITVTNRDYFRTAVKRNSTSSDYQMPVLESIISWNNSARRAVISMPILENSWKATDGLKVVAIQSKMQSVIDCVVPSGYKFCIANKQGMTWFHSNLEKNLNENIFEECVLKNSINNILYNKGRVSTVTYENKTHDLFLIPIKGFPLFLIVMREHTGQDQSKAHVTEFTFILVAAQIFMVMVTVIIIWLTWRRSLTRFPARRSTDWLKPDDNKTMEYVKIALLNIGIALVFLSFAGLEPIDEIAIFLLTPFYVLPVYYLFLNNQTVDDFAKRLNRTLIIVISFIIILMNITLIELEASWHVFVFQIILVISVTGWLYLAHNSKSTLPHFRSRISQSISLKTAYSLALSSLFLIIAIFPAFEFHRIAFNFERVKYQMMMQYETIRETSEKPDGSNVYFLSGTIKTRKPGREPLGKFKDFDKLSRITSLIMDTSSMSFIKKPGAFYAYANNNPWTWSVDSNAIYFTPLSREPGDHVSSLRSIVQEYHPPHMKAWIAGMLGVTYLFFFTRSLVTRMFIFDINRNLVEADIFLITTGDNDLELKENDPPELHLFANDLFIIGLPFSGKKNYIDKLYPPDPVKRLVVDLVKLEPGISILPEEEEIQKYEVIILDHFEYDFLNVKRSNLKLVLLEKLFLTWKKKIVILSAIHTTQMLDTYKINDTKRNANMAKRWDAAFSHFYTIFFPLQKMQLCRSAVMAKFHIDEQSWTDNQHYYDFIEEECSHGIFLQNLKPTMYNLVEVADKNKLTIEELSEKVKSLAYTYYASIWSNCSKDERFLIYDLAEGGLVNVKNTSSITLLIYKGLFTQRRTLSIMNRSFRNFVLNNIGQEEVLAMRKQTLNDGTWNSVKGPIIFIFVIGLLFLVYTQRGLVNEIMAFLGILVAAIPAFLKSFTSVENPFGSKRRTL